VKYTVDNVPWYLLPAFWLYGYGGGLLLWIWLRLIRLSCRIEYHGREWLTTLPNYILTGWHDQVIVGAVTIPHLGNHSLMNHAAAYMKPVHVYLRLSGCKQLILGSSGHGGRAAADELVDCLRRGRSTTMVPDGPYGPARELKKGVLHMSAQSGVPILPFRTEVSATWRFPGWDGKYVPRFGSRVVVHIGPPVQVAAANLDEMATVVARHLG
jgi:lysophospholipid acyltransferase (LPLAT)-like uncharacterized protein